MTKSRMIIIGLCALTVTIVTGAWLQQRALQQELASVTEALRATQARSDELAQTLEETREAATRLKRAHQEQLVASTKIAEASPAPRPVAAASPVPVTPTAEDQSDTPPETLTDKEKEQLAITKLDDYLTRTADADRRTRMRQGRRLLAELRELGPSATVALQQALLDAETSRDRSAAATLLGGLQDPAALPMLKEILVSDDDLLVRRAAARGLRLMDSPETIPVFEALIDSNNDDRFVRFNAALGLAQLGQPDGVDGLVQIFGETAADGQGRYFVFRTLTRLDDKAALPAMRQVLNETADVSYQVGALEFIARHGSTDDADLVRQTLDNAASEPAVIEAAQKALNELTIQR